jgi:hypothetical protein
MTLKNPVGGKIRSRDAPLSRSGPIVAGSLLHINISWDALRDHEGGPVPVSERSPD